MNATIAISVHILSMHISLTHMPIVGRLAPFRTMCLSYVRVHILSDYTLHENKTNHVIYAGVA